MPYLVHLLSSSESMDMNSLTSLDFGSTCSNPSINLKYSGPSLSISDAGLLRFNHARGSGQSGFGLFGEHLDRLRIGRLLNRFDLTLERG